MACAHVMYNNYVFIHDVLMPEIYIHEHVNSRSIYIDLECSVKLLLDDQRVLVCVGLPSSDTLRARVQLQAHAGPGNSLRII